MTDHLTEQVLKLFTLNDDQREAAIEPSRDVVVTAGAGSGKTSTLVARYACLLAKGKEPRRIAAITFSIKAAQEMRSRVRSTLLELQEKAMDETDQQHWSELSTQIDSARIGTIHSLCAEILRNHPAEAGLDPRFDLIDEGLSASLRVQVVEDTLAKLVEEGRFLPLLFQVPVRDLSKMLVQMLKSRLETQEAFEIAVDNRSRLIKELGERMASPQIMELINELREMSPLQLKADAGEKLADVVRELLADWSLAEKALEDNDPVQCALNLYKVRRVHLMTRAGTKGSITKENFLEFRVRYDALLNPLTYGAVSNDELPSTEAEALFEQLLPLLREAFDRVHQAYRAQLDRRQALDFDDLEDYAHRLLKIPEVRQRWQNELDAVMVDEYQDTNRRQRDIVNALAGDRGCLFMVGDMRQSIYRFRRADVTVFREEQDRIKRQNGLLVDLDRTYRAHEQLLDATGDLLSDVIGTEDDPVRKYYVPYTPLVADKKTPEHPVLPPHVEFIVGAGEDAATAKPIAGQALAARLQQLKQEGQTKNWDDVVLLFRASTGYTYYEEALEDAGIPFVTVAGRGFYDRPEIRDLLNILRAIADPLDDLSFAGLLRSPAFGLSDAGLFQLRQSEVPYWQALQGDLSDLSEPDQAGARHVLQVLNLLMPMVDRVPVAELLKRVIDELDYRAILAKADVRIEDSKASKAGGRLWRNLDKLLADTQLSQAVNVRDFLDMLETLNDAGAREGEASAEAEGSVRLMTIHSSKGLEFPIVVLADAGRGKPSNKANAFLSDELGVTFKLDSTPMFFRLAKFMDKDQDECEDFRILYVALTRAQSKLIISSHATGDVNGLVKLPSWGKALGEVVGLPPEGFTTQGDQPFIIHTSGEHSVRAVCLSKPISLSPLIDEAANSNDLIESDLPPLYQPVEGFGQVEPPDELEIIQHVQSWRATQTDGRVSGKILGLIVHKALQRWLFPGDPALKRLLESEAYRYGLATEATRQEVTERATDLLERFREHPVWQEIDLAQERYSELPYSYVLNDKVENRVIDLLYLDVNGWHIIDFKTDPISTFLHKEHLSQKYAPQVRRYKAVVESKLVTAASGKLCFLDDQGEVSVVEV
jgi:ATP-dependent helicase/nuclease subunit A